MRDVLLVLHSSVHSLMDIPPLLFCLRVNETVGVFGSLSEMAMRDVLTTLLVAVHDLPQAGRDTRVSSRIEITMNSYMFCFSKIRARSPLQCQEPKHRQNKLAHTDTTHRTML